VEAQLWQATESAVQSHAAWQRLEAVHTLSQRSATLQTRAYSLGESTLNDTLQARRLALESRLAAETARLEAVLAGWVVRGE
jgi:outer membrane protein TolC